MRRRNGSCRNAAASRPVGLEDRRARIADRAEPLEPGHAAEVEPARLGRRRRRRQPRLPEQPHRRAAASPPASKDRAISAPAPASRDGSSPWITTRSSSTRGRSLADRSSPITRPSTLAVISLAAAPAPPPSRSAARPPRSRAPGRSSAKSSDRAIGPARNRAPPPQQKHPGKGREHPAVRLGRHARSRRAIPSAKSTGTQSARFGRCASISAAMRSRPRPLFSREISA